MCLLLRLVVTLRYHITTSIAFCTHYYCLTSVTNKSAVISIELVNNTVTEANFVDLLFIDLLEYYWAYYSIHRFNNSNISFNNIVSESRK